MSLRFEERVSHSAADDQGVDLRQQVADDRELVGDFGAAEDRNERTDRFFNGVTEERDLFFHQEARNGGRDVFGDDSGGGMGAVRGAERVVAIDIAIGSELFSKLFLLLFESGFRSLELFIGLTVFLFEFGLFFLVVTGIFQHQDVARLHCGDFRVRLCAVGGKRDRLAEQFGEVIRNQLEGGVGGDSFFIGTAEMAHENEASALFENVFDGGEGALDTGIVFDDAFFDRHVEVNAHDNALAFEIDIAKSLFIHVFLSLF